MKNIKEWLSVIAVFIVLILPGIALLWKVIIFNIFPDVGVVFVCTLMFIFGFIIIFILLDSLLGKDAMLSQPTVNKNNRGENDGKE